MAQKPKSSSSSVGSAAAIPPPMVGPDVSDVIESAPLSTVAASPDDLLLAALARGEASGETGRHVMVFRPGAMESALGYMQAASLKVADARDFEGQAVRASGLHGADSIVFPEIGVAVMSSAGLEATRSISTSALGGSDTPFLAVEPEHFVFAEQSPFLRGFLAAANAIAQELEHHESDFESAESPVRELPGFTWGLIACRVPKSRYDGRGIKLAILDTGIDLGHPDFSGRHIVSESFISGQGVQDLHGHGTHCAGTAAGPSRPTGTGTRYGVASAASLYVGKVLSNAGNGTDQTVLAGMNWAIANRCEVISMSLGGPSPVSAAYTNAGDIALDQGSLIVAAAGNAAASTGAPANSPTIMSVASLDQDLAASTFSNFGKIEIAGPGRDVYSAWPRPKLYNAISGTSMATPHVAGCAAMWAQSSASLRGRNLWKQLESICRAIPEPPNKAGAGLVQAP